MPRLRSLNHHELNDSDCLLIQNAKKILWTQKNSITAGNEIKFTFGDQKNSPRMEQEIKKLKH